MRNASSGVSASDSERGKLNGDQVRVIFSMNSLLEPAGASRNI